MALPSERPRRLPRLRHWRDWQSLVYLGALPALAVWQWVYGFHWLPYGAMLFLTLGVSAIHHNHAHLRLWRGRWANRFTDLWLTLLQGHPTLVFWPAHVANHHRHRHGPKDVARTYRFGGDTNHLSGYLLHPLHAHADGQPRPQGASLDYARNFEGLIKPLLFNIGLHTAHHEHSKVHWSALSRLHREHYRARVDSALNERGLVVYMAGVFVLGALVPRFRSRSLMSPNSHPQS